MSAADRKHIALRYLRTARAGNGAGPRRLIGRLVACAALAGAGACGKKAASAPAPLPLVDGVYQFVERPAQLDQSIEGTVTIVGDTLIVDARPGPCRYDEQASWGKNHPFTYRCADITLTFDRYTPISRASYRTTTTVNERRTVCVEYARSSTGQQVCVKQETQTIPRQVSISGSLHPTRIANPD